MNVIQIIKTSSRLRKVLAGVLIFFIIFSIVGFFVLPPVLKSVLTRKLSETLHREVTIGEIKINPFALSMDVKGFAVKDRVSSERLFSFEELYLNIQSISLLKRGLILKELRLVRPYIHIIRNEDMSYNFSDLIKNDKASSSSKPLRFSLNNIRIINGSLDFLDGPKHTRHEAKDINLTIPFVSDLPYYVDTFEQPSFEAKVNGHPVSFKGRTKPFANSHETIIDLDVKDLDIPYYLAYAPFKMNFKLPSGHIDVKTSISYVQYRDRAPSLTVRGGLAFKEVKILDESDGPLINLPLVEISVAPSDLMSRKIHLAKVSIHSPEVTVTRDKAGRLNMQSLIPAKKEESVQRKQEQTSSAIDIDEIDLSGGKIPVSDSMKKRVFSTTLEPVDLKVTHFSNEPGKKSSAALSFRTESNETMKLTGDFSLSPLSAEGTVEVRQIALKKYSPYYSEQILFGIEEGSLDLFTRFTFSGPENEPETRLSATEATVRSLRLKKEEEKEDFLRLPEVSIKGGDIDLAKKEIVVEDLSTQKGVLAVKRMKDGKVNVETLFPPSPEVKKGAGHIRKGKGKEEKEWRVMMKNISAENYEVKVEDFSLSQPVKLHAGQINLKGENISNAKNSKGKASLALTINKKGSVSAAGSIGLNPMSAKLRLNCRSVDILPVQPYFTDKIKIILTGGRVSAKGSLDLGYSQDRGLKANYKGEASVTKFSSLDRTNSDDFLKWDNLYFSGIDAGYNPLSVSIKEIALTDFYSRLVINKDGSVNVQGVVEEESAKPAGSTLQQPQNAPASGKNQPQKQITIDKVTLQGGTINFTDRHIEPSYSANLLEIGGRISGLSSKEETLADVDLRGKLENYAPLEIKGKINPLREDLFVDLSADFKDMDLSSLTPYSGRYVGYTIQKGKLAFTLKYLIVKRKLDSQNNIFFDQLTLGDRVESPEATKLPVKLAIALLKNRKGEISLDVPVTGNIDDPKFSLGRIILKILVNILVKAATSPFSLLGKLFGGGEELGYLEFDYGSHDISEPGQKKLDTLIKALHDRPSLKLDIEGFDDIEKDREGLRQSLFHKKIKAQKLKALVKEGLAPVPVEEVKIGPEEYPKYLKMAYKAEKFPKPRNIIGMAKDLPTAEMEKLMLTHIVVTDDDLRQLASQRALKAKDYILKSGQIEPARVFLVEPKSLQPEKKEKLKESRVDFKLK